MPEDINTNSAQEYFPTNPSILQNYQPNHVSSELIKAIGNKSRQIKKRTGEHQEILPIVSEVHGDVLANREVNDTVKHFVQNYDALLADLEDRLSVPESGMDIGEKTYQAIFNQRIAQSLYIVSKNPNSSEYRQAEYYFRVIQSLKDQGNRLGVDAMLAMSNAKGQAAAMRLFAEGGWDIFVPDVENEDEVRDMDVISAGDFLAIRGGVVVFIDAKGRADSGVVEAKQQWMNDSTELRDSVARTMNSLRAQGVDISKGHRHMRVEIPTSYNNMHTLGVLDDPNASRKVCSVADRLK